jgi:hypothetical protein
MCLEYYPECGDGGEVLAALSAYVESLQRRK